MNNLINDGLGLMMLGMGFVFLFLGILIFATTYMSKLLTHYFPEVMPATKKPQRAPANGPAAVDPNIAAAITAAIHQHRNR
ncbi:oxaloacetate decarboxylase [Marinomonas piezotolerans]|uniref:Probable oxaloacetate decarboxylase gamma chain n=1 Tax=Marinomonas piezotolerans TaxID=2213058 RepID=A0A370U4F8_9GAMM|nr:OadG family transporter subunit [Marinomonas piezotolerans]RDL42648.1 oxaloacetate decarboxylase [Marinomonas piezotolerans]